MENISNLSVLFNILLNGMITVFIVLSLVFFLGKAIIYFFDSNSDDNETKATEKDSADTPTEVKAEETSEIASNAMASPEENKEEETNKSENPEESEKTDDKADDATTA